MALTSNDSPDDRELDDEFDHAFDDAHLGEVPAGLGSDLYAKRLENLSRDEAFDAGVISFADADGVEQEIKLEDVEAAEHDHHSNRTKIVLRSGAAVVVTGAVIAGAVAAIRYRRKHKS